MTDMTHGIKRGLETDVLALQTLSSPSDRFGGQIAAMTGTGSTVCTPNMTCCQTLNCDQTICLIATIG
jgi:hypothetical protein